MTELLDRREGDIKRGVINAMMFCLNEKLTRAGAGRRWIRAVRMLG